jgi:hypothetical protein
MAIAANHDTLALTGWIALGVLGAAVLAAVVRRVLRRRGRREPWVVRAVNRASDKVVDAIKRPITIAVLDEVADVLETGYYTRNMASALEENRREIKAMIVEKIKRDPSTGRINFVPFHDRLLDDISETAIRVVLEFLTDPRTDELISDLLRDNIDQIRQALRDGVDERSGRRFVQAGEEVDDSPPR